QTTFLIKNIYSITFFGINSITGWIERYRRVLHRNDFPSVAINNTFFLMLSDFGQQRISKVIGIIVFHGNANAKFFICKTPFAILFDLHSTIVTILYALELDGQKFRQRGIDQSYL